MEIKIEIGDNLKEVMLKLIEATPSGSSPAQEIKHSFNLDIKDMWRQSMKMPVVASRDMED